MQDRLITLIVSTDFLGLVAGFLTTIAFLPQLIKIWKTQSADDISIGMFTLFATGVALWGVYGLEIHSIPVVVANSVTLVLSLIILFLKMSFEKKKST